MARHDSKIPFAINIFASTLFEVLPNDENLFFSPLVSISAAFGMLYQGVKGKTADEMRAVFGYNSATLTDDQIHNQWQQMITSVKQAKKDYIFTIANRVLVQLQEDFPVLDTFKEGVTSHYNAMVQEVDFVRNAAPVIEEVNEFVKKEPRGKISQVLKTLDRNTRVVLVNAVS